MKNKKYNNASLLTRSHSNDSYQKERVKTKYVSNKDTVSKELRSQRPTSSKDNNSTSKKSLLKRKISPNISENCSIKKKKRNENKDISVPSKKLKLISTKKDHSSILKENSHPNGSYKEIALNSAHNHRNRSQTSVTREATKNRESNIKKNTGEKYAKHRPKQSPSLEKYKLRKTKCTTNINKPEALELSSLNKKQDIVNSTKQTKGTVMDPVLSVKKTTIENKCEDSTNHSILKRKLCKINKKDLEDIIIEQFIEKVLTDHELGYQRSLSMRLEETLINSKNKIHNLITEVKELKIAVNSVALEQQNRKNILPPPTKIKRSVCLQVTEAKILQHTSNLENLKVKASTERINLAKKTELAVEKKLNSIDNAVSSTNTGTSFISNSKKKKESDVSTDIITIDQNEPTKETNYNKHTSKNSMTENNKLKEPDDNVMDDLVILSDSITPRIEVPAIPIQESHNIPPQPNLQVKTDGTTIVLSWDLEKWRIIKPITSFHLILSEKSNDVHTKTMALNWRKIGSVKALDLPMACTLTEFQGGKTYYFSIRAVDCHGVVGPYADSRTIKFPFQKPNKT